MSALPDRYRPRTGRLVLLVTLLVLLNLPVLLAAGTAWRLAAEGIETRGDVLEAQRLGSEDHPLYFVAFRMDGEVDPRRTTWRAQMEPAAWADADRTDELSVTVLPGDPATFAVDGAREGREGLWFTLAADVVLLGLAALAARHGRRSLEAERRRRRRVELSTGRPFADDATTLRLVAAGDLAAARAGAPHAWRRQPDGSVEVCGEVVAIRDDEVELRVDDRRVTVLLADHRNEAGFRGLARVRARLADPAEERPGA